jgi:hypothetical protein
MTKEETEKIYIELLKIHKKLVLNGYSSIGHPVQAPIKRAERAVKVAMEMLIPVIEGK